MNLASHAPEHGFSDASLELFTCRRYYTVMFPTLGAIRDDARRMFNADRTDIPADVRELLWEFANAAGRALPVPTIGDEAGTSPPAASAPAPAIDGEPGNG